MKYKALTSPQRQNSLQHQKNYFRFRNFYLLIILTTFNLLRLFNLNKLQLVVDDQQPSSYFNKTLSLHTYLLMATP